MNGHSRSKKSGLPPGTMVHIGRRKTERTRITYFDYNQTAVKEKEVQNLEELYPLKKSRTISWINVDGLHEVELIGKIGKYFDLHSLMLEDIVNTEQRPKLEQYGDVLFVVLKMLLYDDKKHKLEVEQVSIVLSRNVLISFQEHPPEVLGDVFDNIRERIRKQRLKKHGADYLLYALVDAIVDNYFVILEKMGERIEHIEKRLLGNNDIDPLPEIHRLKQQLIFLRKSIWPLREVVGNLQHTETKLVEKSTNIYFRDVYDHTLQAMDQIETFREMTTVILDIYLSNTNYKLNEVMKVLTIMGTIFIPLTFIASIYGMNFEFMPELHSKYGYFIVVGVMAIVGISLVYYFKRKKWL